MGSRFANHDKSRIHALEQQVNRLEFRLSRSLSHDEAEQLRRDRTAVLNMLAHAVEAAGGTVEIPQNYQKRVPKLRRQSDGHTITLTTRQSYDAVLADELPQDQPRKRRFVSLVEAVEGEIEDEEQENEQ